MGAVTCDIQYSGAARALVVGAAFATMALVLVAPIAPRWQVVALMWVALVGCRALRRLSEVRAVRVDEEGAIEVFDRGQWRSGRVLPGSVVLPWLTVVRWRPTGAWVDRAVVIVPSTTDGESFRKLRVLLRWGKPPNLRGQTTSFSG